MVGPRTAAPQPLASAVEGRSASRATALALSGPRPMDEAAGGETRPSPTHDHGDGRTKRLKEDTPVSSGAQRVTVDEMDTIEFEELSDILKGEQCETTKWEMTPEAIEDAGHGPVYKVVTEGDAGEEVHYDEVGPPAPRPRGGWPEGEPRTLEVRLQGSPPGRPMARGPLLAFVGREHIAHHRPDILEAGHGHVQLGRVERFLPRRRGQGAAACPPWCSWRSPTGTRFPRR